MSTINSISDIKNIFYINLEHRTDRKLHIEQQLKNLGLTQFERFNAIKLSDGRVGCSMSHLKCLQIAKERNYDHLLICEDDTTFLNPSLFINKINTFFQKKFVTNWDVLLFAGNNVPPYKIVDETCIQVNHCQTTTCYLVNGNYFDVLIDNIKKGIQLLIKEPTNHINYAIDKYWLQLQKIHKWFLIIPLTVIQREDYSDIEQKRINYSGMMTDLNKEHLFTQVSLNKNIIKNKFSTMLKNIHS
jgi:GR25 family glycosyltransferase involved in LPS biosynthesis